MEKVLLTRVCSGGGVAGDRICKGGSCNSCRSNMVVVVVFVVVCGGDGSGAGGGGGRVLVVA